MGTVSTRYRFDLPNDAWFIGEAPEGYDFIVAHSGNYPAFRPNIGATTVGVAPGTVLATVMEDSATVTATNATNLSVGEDAMNDDGTVGRQTLSFAVEAPAGTLELTQYQVFYLLPDMVGEGRELRVLCVVMTAETRDAAELYDDFDAFLDTLRFVDEEE